MSLNSLSHLTKTTALILSFFFFSAYLISCQKSSNVKSFPEIFIKFKVGDSLYEYKYNNGYNYFRGTSYSTDAAGKYDFKSLIYLTPSDPPDVNIYTVGFVFPYYCRCFYPDFYEIGDSIFHVGNKSFCNTGNIPFYVTPNEIFCNTDNNGFSFYWTPPNEEVMYSAFDDQPLNSFFTIDSVYDYNYDINVIQNDFDKIIKGRFQCRVFGINNTDKYYDITEGVFQLGVWKNGLE